MDQPSPAQPSQYKALTREQKIGLMWLVLPIACLPIILSIFAIVKFVTYQLAVSGDPVSGGVGVSMINVILSLLGLLCVLGIIIGIPLGIVYILKDTMPPGTPTDPRSGLGAQSEVPPEIRGWSWGAAGLTWIWGISHRVWLSLLMFVPVVNMVWWIVLGLKGN